VGREVTTECPIIDEEGMTWMPESGVCVGECACVCVCVIRGSISPTILRIYSLSHLSLLIPLSIFTQKYTLQCSAGLLCRIHLHSGYPTTFTHTHVYTYIYTCACFHCKTKELILFITRSEATQMQGKIPLIRVSE